MSSGYVILLKVVPHPLPSCFRSESELAQSCPTLCNPMDCSPVQLFATPWTVVLSNSLQPHRLLPTTLLRPWDFPGKTTGVGCHFLLKEIFPTQGSNAGLPHCRQTLYCLSHQGSPCFRKTTNRYLPSSGLLILIPD